MSIKTKIHNIVNWFKLSFQDKTGKPDGRAITISLSFIMLCTMAILNQVFSMDVEENIYDSFWWIVVIGLGILSPELVSKFTGKLTKTNESTQDSPKDSSLPHNTGTGSGTNEHMFK